MRPPRRSLRTATTFSRAPSPVHSAHVGQELEVYYRWHPYFGRKVLVRRVEQRATGQFLKVLGPADVVVSMAGWMLDPVVCIANDHALATRQHDFHLTRYEGSCRCRRARLNGDLGRHECNRSLDHERRRPLHLSTPGEQHVGVQVVATRDNRHRSARLKCLRNDPSLVIRRPSPSPPAITPLSGVPAILQRRHRLSCPLALSGHDHRATLHANIREPLTPRPGGPHRRDTSERKL
jgi:hypothetical protein